MSIAVPPSLLENADTRTVIDAIYYVVRVLRNATRGYRDPLVSTEPSPEARELAERALKEIESHEKAKIPQLETAHIREYIGALEELLRTVYMLEVGNDTVAATRILDEMRLSRE